MLQAERKSFSSMTKPGDTQSYLWDRKNLFLRPLHPELVRRFIGRRSCSHHPSVHRHQTQGQADADSLFGVCDTGNLCLA